VKSKTEEWQMNTSPIEQPKVVSREEWLAARKALLRKEKAQTQAADELSRDRRALPWVKMDKTYLFDSPRGKETLGDLFDGRSQLIVNHFMLGPGWKEGCVGCSFGADHASGALVHLEHHDVSYVAVSRAPLPEIETFKERMGWPFRWVSSFGSDFNYDFGVSFTQEAAARGTVVYNYETRPFESEELSGTSVFYKDEAGDVFHTYSTFARGGEKGLTSYMYLDLLPKGRNENGPHHSLADWVRHHDRYDSGGFVDATGRYQAPQAKESPCGCETSGPGRAF
jgi:predicted dithiol-disulfide oxidoreductase (DUF899 family)